VKTELSLKHNAAFAQGKLFLAATRIRRHVAITPTFAGSLPVLFLSPWATSGSSQALMGGCVALRGLYIDMRVKGSMKMIIYKRIFAPAYET
jgi:hypothetical protein